MRIYGNTQFFLINTFSPKYPTSFNPPAEKSTRHASSPVEGGNIPRDNLHNLFINLEVNKFSSLSLIRLSQSSKKQFIGQCPFTLSWEKIYSAKRRPFTPSWEGDVRGWEMSHKNNPQRDNNPQINKLKE